MKITNTSRKILNFPTLIADNKQCLDLDRQQISAHFDQGHSISETLSFVIATADGFYAVGASDHNLATVYFNQVFPQKFTQAKADDLVANFKTSNGHWPIVWVKMAEDNYPNLKKAT